jgi:hypothetical protein
MKKKRASLVAAEKAMDSLLKRVGYTGKYKGKSVNEIPTYRSDSKVPPTSDKICGNGSKKEANRYTGTEIMGISTMHKSNLVPIRKDNKQSAIDAAQMRRN